MTRFTLEYFIKRAKEIHGKNTYDYSMFVYTRAKDKSIIICPKEGHGEFPQSANKHLQPRGCPKCGREKTANSKRSNIEEFIEKAKIVHKDKYDYSNVNYINVDTNIDIICSKDNHGVFSQRPDHHLAGSGCSKCVWVKNGNRQRKTIEQFIQQAKEIHKDKYDYTLTEYCGDKKDVKIWCKKCKEFFYQRSDHHLSGCGCAKCSKMGCYSVISIRWLIWIAHKNNIHIRHWQNEGEYKIQLPNGNYISFDGFCKETNTVYEFYGCFFHGCECCFNLDKTNTLLNKTYGELLDKTLEREKFIKEQGYNLITIWEHEWREMLKKIKSYNLIITNDQDDDVLIKKIML